MFPVYRVPGVAQPSRMDEPKRKRPWSPWQYLTLIVIAIVMGVFVIRPVGLEIAGVFQRLTDAFQHGK